MSEFWDQWETGSHPYQAEVHEPIEREFIVEGDQEITYGVYLHSSGEQGGYVVRTMWDGWCPKPYSHAKPLRVYKRKSAAEKYADRLNDQ